MKIFVCLISIIFIWSNINFSMGEKVQSEWLYFEAILEAEYKGTPVTVTGSVLCDIRNKRRYHREIIKRQYGTYMEKVMSDGNVLVVDIPIFCHSEGGAELEMDINKIYEDYLPQINKNYLPLISIVTDKNETKRIEQIISPDYYKQKNTEVKFKSFKIRKVPYAEENKFNRYSWKKSNFASGDIKLLRDFKDRGYYFSFGTFIYPKEVWSKILPIKKAIENAVKNDPDYTLYFFDSKGNRKIQKLIAYLGRLSQGARMDDIGRGLGYLLLENSYGRGILDPTGNSFLPNGYDTEEQKPILKALAKEFRIFNSKYYYYSMAYNGKHWYLRDDYKGKIVIAKYSKATMQFEVPIGDSEYCRYFNNKFIYNKVVFSQEYGYSCFVYDKGNNKILYPGASMWVLK